MGCTPMRALDRLNTPIVRARSQAPRGRCRSHAPHGCPRLNAYHSRHEDFRLIPHPTPDFNPEFPQSLLGFAAAVVRVHLWRLASGSDISSHRPHGSPTQETR